jgi:L-lactate dehydrogenase (cytochrome)
MSICSIEDVAERTTKPFWFQLYVMKDRGFIERLIERAKAANCSALVLTLDLQILGQRHKDLKNGLTAPPKLTIPNILNMATKPRWCLGMAMTPRRTFRNIVGHATGVGDMSSLSSWTAEQFDPGLSWADVEWIKKLWGGKLIIKGILDEEDARFAADSGADALIVSNHGGRQFDRGQVPLEILPEVVKAVGNKVEIYIDGGIMSGLDALGAIALGAKAVFIGRAYLYGAMANGEAGIEQVIEIMRREFENGMALSGATNIAEVRKNGARIRN